jgi:hypothetical protein
LLVDINKNWVQDASQKKKWSETSRNSGTFLV